MGRRLPQRRAEGGVGLVVGGHAFHVFHLHHEEQRRPQAGLRRPLQLPDVLHSPLRGRVGEAGRAAVLQGDALDLDQEETPGALHAEVQAGVPICVLPAEDRPLRQAGRQPFGKYPVGRLGVHVYQQLPLPHGNEVIRRLPAGVFVFLQIDGRPGDQQLPAAARIFYVDGLDGSLRLHLGDEAVGPGEKAARDHGLILHSGLLSGGAGKFYRFLNG